VLNNLSFKKEVDLMPSQFTDIIGKLYRLSSMRKSFLQGYAQNNGVAWEYVPILEYIKKSPGCIQVDISNKLGITAAAVTQSTKKLEALGLIRKETNKENLRIKQLYITEKGTLTLSNGTRIFDMTDKLMFNNFTESETNELRRLLDKATANLIESEKQKQPHGENLQ
jgi:DNA-binding MarR family transcriptional regulator